LLRAAATNLFALPQARRIDLRQLVQSNAVLDLDAARELRVEADTLEAMHGPNAYSDYLRRHGHLPDPDTAATIGKVLGARVQANDGSLQPPLTVRDRAAAKENRERQRAYAKRHKQIAGMKLAIATLAGLEADAPLPACEVLSDPELVVQLGGALRCLRRFAEHWHGQSQKPSAQKQGARH
jgi:hypothetical protein